MKKFVEFRTTKEISELEHILSGHYETLMKELKGQEPTEKENEMFDFNSMPHVRINPRNLRLATEAFANVLKEIKKVAK